MQSEQLLFQEVIDDSLVFSLASEPHIKKIIPLRQQAALEMALVGKSASEVFATMQSLKQPISLEQIYDVFEKVNRPECQKPKALLASTQSSFLPTIFERKYFGFDLNFNASLPKFFAAAIAILTVVFLLALLGPVGFLKPIQFSGFLLDHDRFDLFKFSIWISIFCILLFKSALQFVVQALLFGRLPSLRVEFGKIMPTIVVDTSRVLASASTYANLVYWLISSYALLAAVGLLSWTSWVTDELQSLRILCLILTLLSLNPSWRGEFYQIFFVLFPETTEKRLIPFLKNRSLLFGFSSVGRQKGEEHLLLYSGLSLLWRFGFVLVLFNVFNANFANWWIRLPAVQTSVSEKISIVLIAGCTILGLVVLIADLFCVLIRNLVFKHLSNFYRFVSSRQKVEILEKQPQILKEHLKKNLFFGALSDSVVDQVIHAGFVKKIPVGYRLIVQGDSGQELFVLVEGEASVIRRDELGLEETLATLKSGAVFGEIALIREVVRTADVVIQSLGGATVFVLEKSGFKNLIAKGQESQLLEARVALTSYFADSAVFEKLSSEDRQQILSHGTFHRVKQGEVLCSADKPASDYFYLLIRGRAEARYSESDTQKMSGGDFFGLDQVLAPQSFVVNFVSLEDCLLLSLDENSFWQIANKNLNVAVEIENIQNLRKRVRV